MVFIQKAKKGGKPNQKLQGKKPFQEEADVDMSDFDDDDMDSDDNESDDALVTKTPKGRMSLNEKRVSFQVPGKNTPAKTPVGKKPATPARNESASKKQATPGKGGLAKFKGMEQQNQKSKKGSQPDDEDDDDDDEEDEDDSDFGGDLDLSLGGGDDDDDDDEDDDDDDDEDDDDDDDDEEEESIQQNILKGKKQNVAQANKQTPLKGEKPNAQTPKGAQTPKVAATPKAKESPAQKTPKQEKSAVSPKAAAIIAQEEERRNKRDATQLYLGNLPADVTAQELKDLSSDILSVSLPKRARMNRAFAFLQFASEGKAEENFKTLKTELFKGAPLTIDYVGCKSARQSKDSHPSEYNPRKLFVSGLPLDVTVQQVAKFFPKCHTVSLNQSSTYRAATVFFWTEEEGSAAFEETKDIEIKGVKVSVLHSKMSKPISSKRKRNVQRKNKITKQRNNGHVAKKMKFIKKAEADSDDE